jgi:hypothetical protein
MHKQASYHRRPQREHWPGDCSHSCVHVTTTCRPLRQFGLSHHAMHGRQVSAPYVTGLSFKMSEGLRYLPIAFDYCRCINSGFVAESMGPLV